MITLREISWNLLAQDCTVYPGFRRHSIGASAAARKKPQASWL